MRRRVIVLGVVLTLAIALTPARAESQAPLIAAASDLQFALREIGATYEAKTGERLRLTFGSSGQFATQIRSGAPIELFFSADEGLVQGLAKDGLTQGEGAVYAEGRLALFLPNGSLLKGDETLADLAAAAKDGRLQRLAIANPEHAPYGRRAEEALTKAGMLPGVRSKLVFGENVSQAAQFVASGAASAGIIAYSLALSPDYAKQGRHALISKDLHTPLIQRMVLLPRAGPIARTFFAYLQSPEARTVLARHGFAVPQ